jgi:hypothetical protein
MASATSGSVIVVGHVAFLRQDDQVDVGLLLQAGRVFRRRDHRVLAA